MTPPPRKDDAGKLRYDLIPPIPLATLAHAYTIGAEKYGARNWEQGIEFTRLYAAAMRHLQAWYAGESQDPEGGQHHIASVAFCCLAIIELELTHPECDDRPRWPSRRPQGLPPDATDGEPEGVPHAAP